ncbi:Serine/threonine-protein kinase nekl-3 [Diplonema papillatum]|nr:Serine/threonine-protein kinase nekl-3 [Diplonema papillatum]
MVLDLSAIGYKSLHQFEGTSVHVVQSKAKKKYALKHLVVASEAEADAEFEFAYKVSQLGVTMGIVDCKQLPGNSGGVSACLVYDLCENGTLTDYISSIKNRDAIFSEPNVFRVIRQMSDALQRLHENNVWHLNLTPDHVIFCSAAKLVLGGLRPASARGLPAVPAALPAPDSKGVVKPPPSAYAPPEAFRGQFSIKTDSWHLGVIVLDLCRVPHFLPDDPLPYLHQRIADNQSREHSRIKTLVRTRYSAELSYVITKLLTEKLEERYSTRELMEYLQGKAGTGMPDFTSFGYRCVELIGKGGSAKVFRIVKLGTEEQFALKQTHLLDDKKQSKDCEKEKDLLQKAAGKGIVEYHDSFFRDSDRGETFFCIVMELCKNSLDGLIGERGRFDEKTILYHLRQLCTAMAHLHKKGIFHRDITPRNILFTEDGSLKLGDFGISNTFGELASNPRTTRIGTPNYVSPEVYAGALQSEKIDMWGIGAITLDLCGVLNLNDRNDLHNRVKNNEEAEHKRIVEGMLTAGYSAQLADLCVQLVQYDPAKRPSADEVLLILKKEFGLADD